jgi:Lon-like ATP-dependent protease
LPGGITDQSDLYKVGTFAQIHRLTFGVGSASPSQSTNPDFLDLENQQEGADGGNGLSETASVLLLAHRRVNLESVDSLGPPIDVTISHWPQLDYTGSDDTITFQRNSFYHLRGRTNQPTL